MPSPRVQTLETFLYECLVPLGERPIVRRHHRLGVTKWETQWTCDENAYDHHDRVSPAFWTIRTEDRYAWWTARTNGYPLEYFAKWDGYHWILVHWRNHQTEYDTHADLETIQTDVQRAFASWLTRVPPPQQIGSKESPRLLIADLPVVAHLPKEGNLATAIAVWAVQESDTPVTTFCSLFDTWRDQLEDTVEDSRWVNNYRRVKWDGTPPMQKNLAWWIPDVSVWIQSNRMVQYEYNGDMHCGNTVRGQIYWSGTRWLTAEGQPLDAFFERLTEVFTAPPKPNFDPNQAIQRAQRLTDKATRTRAHRRHPVRDLLVAFGWRIALPAVLSWGIMLLPPSTTGAAIAIGHHLYQTFWPSVVLLTLCIGGFINFLI